MDPLSIAGLAIIGSYIGYRGYTNSNQNNEKTYMDISKYHELCRKKKTNTPYKQVIDKFKKSMKQSFVMSELSYSLLTLSFNNKDEIAFYLTLIKSIIDKNENNILTIHLFTTHKFNNNLMKQLYDITTTENINKRLHEYDENLELKVEGDTLLINKISLTETFNHAIDHEGKILIYKNIHTNEDNSFIKLDINDNYSLLLIDSNEAFDCKYIFDECKNIEKKKEYVVIPKIGLKTIVELKKIKSLDIKELGDKTNTKNVVSYVSLNLNVPTKKVTLNKYNIITKSKFNFVVIHKPSDQIIMSGLIDDSLSSS